MLDFDGLAFVPPLRMMSAGSALLVGNSVHMRIRWLFVSVTARRVPSVLALIGQFNWLRPVPGSLVVKFGCPRTRSGSWLVWVGAVFQMSTLLLNTSVMTSRAPSVVRPDGRLNLSGPPVSLKPTADSVMSAFWAVVKNPDVPPGATEYEVDG